MKLKPICLGMLLITCALTSVAQRAEESNSHIVFDKGDRKADLSIGIGIVAYTDKSRVTFDQHLGMEWGVSTFADKFTLGIGFAVNNSYGGSFSSLVAGTYDYTYTKRSYGRIYKYSTKKWESFDESKDVHRSSAGTADATIAREDINALFVAAIHYSPIRNLDTYVKAGVGVGYMSWIVSNFKNENGFTSADVNETNTSELYETTDVYKYNDLDHVEWADYESKTVPAMSIYLGATYQITEQWGVDAQIGLISANLKGNKSGYPNSYGIFALGASYRF